MPDARPVRGRGASAIVWLLRVMLAALFFYLGWIKFSSDPRTVWVRIFDQIGFGQWFRIVTAIVECVGGLLLLFPRATPIAVALLVPTMIGALLVHVFVIGVGPASVAATLLMIGVLFIGRSWSRARSSRRT